MTWASVGKSGERLTFVHNASGENRPYRATKSGGADELTVVAARRVVELGDPAEAGEAEAAALGGDLPEVADEASAGARPLPASGRPGSTGGDRPVPAWPEGAGGPG